MATQPLEVEAEFEGELPNAKAHALAFQVLPASIFSCDCTPPTPSSSPTVQPTIPPMKFSLCFLRLQCLFFLLIVQVSPQGGMLL
jgi:hypothetical protein